MKASMDLSAAGDSGGVRGILWRALGARAFRLTFHNWYKLRNSILRAFGASIDQTVRIRESARIDRPWNLTIGRKSSVGEGASLYATAPIRIGERTVCSQFVAICAFRARATGGTFVVEPAPVTIGSDSWIAAESVVDGVDIPDGVVLGACSAALAGADALSPWTIAAGTPARSILPRSYAE